MAPFAGTWKFEGERTLEALKEAGVSEEALASLRKFYGASPAVSLYLLADLTFAGDTATGAGLPSVEYQFFEMHEHSGKVCGKAWHHEDRHDPGDMSKCFVRLHLQDDLLFLEVRMQDGLPDLSDPDFRDGLKLIGGSAASCQCEHPPGTNWGDWTTYVYSRKT